jgi:hypothetical protein
VTRPAFVIVRGVFSVVVIALVADLVWFVLKAMIERRLAEAQGTGTGGVDPGRPPASAPCCRSCATWPS